MYDKYQSIERRMDTLNGRHSYWLQLRRASSDYYQETGKEKDLSFNGDFYTWMRIRYGIEMLYNEEGQVLGDYQISDPDLHLLFLLRYPV